MSSRKGIYRYLKHLERFFIDRSAFISANRFVLTGLLAYNIAYRLFYLGDNVVELYDRWSLSLDTVDRFLKYLGADLEKSLVIKEGSKYIFSPLKDILADRKRLEYALAVYSNGGAALLMSKGFNAYSVKNIGKNTYMIVDSAGNEKTYIKISGYRIMPADIGSKFKLSLDKLYEAYTVYGQLKFSDGVRILVSELGMDRKEANKVLRDLIARGLINVSKGGYLEFL